MCGPTKVDQTGNLGTVLSGQISLGQQLWLGPADSGSFSAVSVTGIQREQVHPHHLCTAPPSLPGVAPQPLSSAACFIDNIRSGGSRRYAWTCQCAIRKHVHHLYSYLILESRSGQLTSFLLTAAVHGSLSNFTRHNEPLLPYTTRIFNFTCSDIIYSPVADAE